MDTNQRGRRKEGKTGCGEVMEGHRRKEKTNGKTGKSEESLCSGRGRENTAVTENESRPI